MIDHYESKLKIIIQKYICAFGVKIKIMTEPIPGMSNKKELLDEIVNRNKLGNKKSHSETSLQQYGENDDVFTIDAGQDPGVLNASLTNLQNADDNPNRKRTMSQPGPVSGSLLTASAARAARKRPQKNVMYAPDLERSESTSDRLRSSNGGDSGTATPTGERGSPLPYNGLNNNSKNGDIKSLNSYRLYIPTNDLKGSATPRKRSVATMDAQSIRSVETHAPPPTNPEDNKKQTKKYITLITSCMYAVLLVTFGLIIYIGDTLVEPSVSVIYSIILCGIGFLYLIFLITDINRYKALALKNLKIKGLHEEKIAEFFRKQEEDFGAPGTPGDRTPEFKAPNFRPPVLIPMLHQYCFSQGRHSGSFYLKLGAAGFALGHLIHSVLLLAVQIGHFLDEDVNNDDCVNILQVVLDVMFPLYCFVQLYFIFKYSNVIILRYQNLARFAFMHMIGSSLCFWVSAIVRETILGLTLYANSIYGNNNYNYEGYSNPTDYELSAIRETNRFLNVSNLFNEECIGSKAISTIFESFSPYLYPFSVEFNILIVAVYFIIWSNIGNCDNEDNESELNSTDDDNTTICRIPTANEENDFTSNIVIYADCHASNKGLFAGLILMVIIAGMLIIGFVFSSVGEEFLELGYLLNNCTKLTLHTLMLIASLVTLNQLRKLDINEHPISLLDDVLLFICLPAFFMETFFSLIATISILNIVKTIDFIVMFIQVTIQTPLIMDGLRRCSNTKKLRRSKPGRELLMFLLIANVGMWLLYTFSYKSPESLDERYAFYGKVLWSILGHVSLPLIMFYRFHSSVCFADIWDSAYKPGSEH